MSVTGDVEQMYPSLLDIDAVDAIYFFGETLEINPSLIYQLVDIYYFIQNNIYVQYKCKTLYNKKIFIYKSQNRLGTGIPHAGAVANLVLLHCEWTALDWHKNNLKNCVIPIDISMSFFSRFLDDIYILYRIKNNRNNIIRAFRSIPFLINGMYPDHLKVKSDYSFDSITYLNLNIIINKCNNNKFNIVFKQFFKPFSIYCYPSYHSNHTKDMLSSILYGLLYNAIMNNTHFNDYKLDEKQIYKRLLNRHYPNWYLRKCKKPLFKNKNLYINNSMKRINYILLKDTNIYITKFIQKLPLNYDNNDFNYYNYNELLLEKLNNLNYNNNNDNNNTQEIEMKEFYFKKLFEKVFDGYNNTYFNYILKEFQARLPAKFRDQINIKLCNKVNKCIGKLLLQSH